MVRRCFPVTFGLRDLFFRYWWLLCPKGFGVFDASVIVYSKITTDDSRYPGFQELGTLCSFPYSTILRNSSREWGRPDTEGKATSFYQFYNHLSNSSGETMIWFLHSWSWSNTDGEKVTLIHSPIHWTNILDKVSRDLYVVNPLVQSQSSHYSIWLWNLTQLISPLHSASRITLVLILLSPHWQLRMGSFLVPTKRLPHSGVPLGLSLNFFSIYTHLLQF